MKTQLQHPAMCGAFSVAELLRIVVFACSITALGGAIAVAQSGVPAESGTTKVGQQEESSEQQTSEPETAAKPASASTAKNKSDTKRLTYAVGESLMPDYGKVILAMILVIGGIYGVVTLLKRMMGRRAGAGGRGDAIELIESLHLSPKKQVTLVRVGTRGALLAVTEGGIQTLLELDNEETSEALELARSKQGAVNFKDTLGLARKKMTDLSAFARKAASISPHRGVQKGVSESA